MSAVDVVNLRWLFGQWPRGWKKRRMRAETVFNTLGERWSSQLIWLLSAAWLEDKLSTERKYFGPGEGNEETLCVEYVLARLECYIINSKNGVLGNQEAAEVYLKEIFAEESASLIRKEAARLPRHPECSWFWPSRGVA